MAGAIAANAHEGSRSEYLAQYVFASFGTAVAVPHQEDSGIDLHCTLTERVGQRAWTRAYFSVQVKSEMKPWELNDVDSVRWLVEHRLPFFLCIVEKKTARIRVYHVCPRFYVWAMPPLPKRLCLNPETRHDGICTQWKDDEKFSLGAPILDVSVNDLLADDCHAKARAVLQCWIDVETANLSRLKAGIHLFRMPYAYVTNSAENSDGDVIQGLAKAPDIQLALTHAKECIANLTSQLYERGDLVGAASGAMLLRHLFSDDYSDVTNNFRLHQKLNETLGITSYMYAGVDRLLSNVAEPLNHPSQPDAYGITSS